MCIAELSHCRILSTVNVILFGCARQKINVDVTGLMGYVSGQTLDIPLVVDATIVVQGLRLPGVNMHVARRGIISATSSSP